MNKILPIIGVGIVLALAGCSGAQPSPSDTNGPAGTVSISTSENMPVNAPVGQTTTWSYTVTNNTNSDVSGLNLSLSPGPVTVAHSMQGRRLGATPACGNTLPKGQSCVFTVSYTPANTQPVQQQLSGSFSESGHVNLVTTPATESIIVNPFFTSLVATGPSSPPTALVNNSVSFTITLQNTAAKGTDPITNINIAPPSSSPIRAGSNTCSNTLSGGDSCVFNFMFSPKSASDANTYPFAISYTEDGKPVPVSSINIITALGNDTYTLMLSQTSPAFPLISTINNPSPPEATLILSKLSQDENTISGFSATGIENTDLSIDKANSTCYNSGATTPCTLTIEYQPTSAELSGSGIQATLKVGIDQLNGATLPYPVSAQVNNGSATITPSVATSAAAGQSSPPFSLTITPSLDLPKGAAPAAIPPGQQTYPISLNTSAGIDNATVSSVGTFSYVGGSFPGTNGTCKQPLDQTSTCTVMLQFTALSTAQPTPPQQPDQVSLGFHFQSGPQGSMLFKTTTNVALTINPAGSLSISPDSSCPTAPFVDAKSNDQTCKYNVKNSNPPGSGSVTVTGVSTAPPLSVSNADACVKTFAPGDTCSFVVTYHAVTAADTSGSGSATVNCQSPASSPSVPIQYSLAPNTPEPPTPISFTATGSPATAKNTTITINFPQSLMGVTLVSLGPDTSGTDPNATFTPDSTSTCPIGTGTPVSGSSCTLVFDFSSAKLPSVSSRVENLTPTLNYTNSFGGGQVGQTIALPLNVTASYANAKVVWGTPSPMSSYVKCPQSVPDCANYPVTQSVTLTNNGPDDVTLGTISLDNASSDMGLDLGSCTPNTTLYGNPTPSQKNNCSITLTYAPQAAESYTANLSAPYTVDGLKGQPSQVQVTGDVPTATLNVAPDYQVVAVDAQGQMSPVPQATPATPVTPDKLFVEPGQKPVLLLKVTPNDSDGTYAYSYGAAVSSVNTSLANIQDITSTVGSKALSGYTPCTEDGKTIVASGSSCYVYLQYTSAPFSQFTTDATLPTINVVTASESPQNTKTVAISNFTLSSTLLYALTDQGLLALSPEDGEVVSTHTLPPASAWTSITSAANPFAASFVIALDSDKSEHFYLGFGVTTATSMGSSDTGGYMDCPFASSCTYQSQSNISALNYGAGDYFFENMSLLAPSSLYITLSNINNKTTQDWLTPSLYNNNKQIIFQNINAPFAVVPFSTGGTNYFELLYGASPSYNFGTFTTEPASVNSGSITGMPFNMSFNPNNNEMLIATNSGIETGTPSATATAPTLTPYFAGNCYDHGVFLQTANKAFLTRGALCAATGVTPTQYIYFGPLGSAPISTSYFDLSKLSNTIYDLRAMENGNFVG